MPAPVHVPTSSAGGFQFLHVLPTLLISGFFLNNNHPNGHEVVPHCDFDLYFSNE